MKQYIMIILIALHIASSTLYAIENLNKKHSIHECSLQSHDHDHHHFHTHNGSSHSHKHNHTQVNTSFVDFFILPQNINSFSVSDSKEKYTELSTWIPNPILESLFRPPKA
jgi:ABC-type Zn2+ transport system substrate-binding protein/surface adhesin